MLNSFPFFIGLRYIRAKRRNHFISFISLASMIGIALGVMVLITVLSVMNGFDDQIKNRIFTVVPQVTVSNPYGMSDWGTLQMRIAKEAHVVATAPFVAGQGMLSSSGVASGIYFTGIEPREEMQASAIAQKMLAGSLEALTKHSFGIVLGVDLANQLGVVLGDKVTLIIPEASVTPVGVLPRFKRCTVVGIFQVGGGFPFDASLAFLNLTDAQQLLQMGNKITGVHVKVADLYDAPTLSEKLKSTLSNNFTVSDWTQEYGSLFKAIQMEKTMIFVILLFIIAVAAFNLVSTLVMVVTDKQSDIAILRTLGATPKTIMNIFMVQGAVVGLVGTLIGVIGGILLALNAPQIVALIEHVFHVNFISSSIYFIDYLPSQLEWQDVLNIGGAALLMSLLATIYPAWRASKTNPVEALRYE